MHDVLWFVIPIINILIQLYFDYMGNFRLEYDYLFEGRIISESDAGLGSCGKLWFSSYSAKI